MKKSVSISLTLSVDRAWNRCLCHHSSEPSLVFWQLLAAKKKKSTVKKAGFGICFYKGKKSLLDCQLNLDKAVALLWLSSCQCWLLSWFLGSADKQPTLVEGQTCSEWRERIVVKTVNKSRPHLVNSIPSTEPMLWNILSFILNLQSNNSSCPFY